MSLRREGSAPDVAGEQDVRKKKGKGFDLDRLSAGGERNIMMNS